MARSMKKLLTTVALGVLAGLVIGFAAGQYYMTETPFDQCVVTHIEEYTLRQERRWRQSSFYETRTFPNGETRHDVPAVLVDTYEELLSFWEGSVYDPRRNFLENAYDDCNSVVYSGAT